MSDPGFDIYNELPAAFFSMDARNLYRLFSRPALIHLPGLRSPAVAVILLLHGNEPVGLQATQRLLQRYVGRTLPRSLILVVGNVEAARYGLRRLDGQPDFNRVWPGSDLAPTAEHGIFSAILAHLRQDGIFAAIDLHNNTGLNPHYACINFLEDRFLNLANLFGRTIVHFTRPRGVASMALATIAPSVTLECGHPNDETGVEHAAQFIDAVLHLSRVPDRRPQPQEMNLFHTVVQVRIRPGCSVDVEADADVILPKALDRMNFSLFPEGTPLVRHRKLRAGIPLVATAQDDRDVTGDYLGVEGEWIVLRRALMPSMLTMDLRVIQQDCLCYLMEPIDIARLSATGAECV